MYLTLRQMSGSLRCSRTDSEASRPSLAGSFWWLRSGDASGGSMLQLLKKKKTSGGGECRSSEHVQLTIGELPRCKSHRAFLGEMLGATSAAELAEHPDAPPALPAGPGHWSDRREVRGTPRDRGALARSLHPGLLGTTRRALATRRHIERTDVDSILRLVRSRLDISIRTALAEGA